jgi:hypothetical protein
MPYLIILSLIFGGLVVYFFLNPSEKIKENEITELESLDVGYGSDIERVLSENNFHNKIKMVERYFYLKHKYNLTKTKTK